MEIAQSLAHRGPQNPEENRRTLLPGALTVSSQQEALEVVLLQEALQVLQEEPFAEPAEFSGSVEL